MEFIKDIFWAMPANLWNEDFMGKFIAIIWYIVIIIGMVLTSFLVFSAVDELGLTYQAGNATIIGKRFDPAHDESYMQPVVIGKSTIMIPHTDHYEDRYFLKLEIKNLTGEKQVSKSVFDDVAEGNKIPVNYSKKRLTDSISFE